MIDKDQERHWDREMAEVDRLLKKLPTYESEAPRSGPGGSGAATVRRPYAGLRAPRGSPLGAWMRVGLGAALAIGMLVWPYGHDCGMRLLFYGAGTATLIVAGLWSAVYAWRLHAGLAHTLSLAIVLWGFVLAAGVVLPRVGYTGAPAPWLCPGPSSS